MADGTFKRCSCRDEGGKQLGKKCPDLTMRDGRNNFRHGSWYYQLELPPKAGGDRRAPLRRGGFATCDDAQDQMDKASELLAISNEPGEKSRIADLIVATLKKTSALPEPDEVRRKIRSGHDLSREITTGQWLTGWLASRKGLRPNTLRSYKSQIRLYLIPVIGHIRLDRLRVTDVAAVFETIDELNEMITAARASGNPELRAKVKGRRVVGPSSKHRVRETLRAALNQAIRERFIDLNVASLVELPSGKRPKPLIWTAERVAHWRAGHAAHIEKIQERKKHLSELEPHKRHGTRANRLDAYISAPRPSPVMVWTPEQTHTFLEYAGRHRLYPLFRLIALRGLRRGEAVGLRWPDLDLDERVVTVRWQIVQLGSENAEGKPKSEAGERHVVLDKDTAAVFRNHKTRQHRERLAAGSFWTDTGFVFTTETGEHLDPADVTEQFEFLAMAAGLPPVRLHDLRHGAATLLLAAGYDMKVVQETLGLSSITIAADTYTSVLPQLARQSAEDAAAIVMRPKRNSCRKPRRGDQPGDAIGEAS